MTAQTLPMQFGRRCGDGERFVSGFAEAGFGVSRLHWIIRWRQGGMAATDVYSWKEVAKIWKSRKAVYRDTATGDFFPSAGSGRKEVKAPRIGLYMSYQASMDEGWTRWLFDDFGFASTTLHDADVQAGNLRSRFDTIVIPDQAAQQIANGYRAGAMPPEFCGGIGAKGAAALKEFASARRHDHFLQSCFGLCDRGARREGEELLCSGVATKDFYSPGSLLNVSLDWKSPLAYGMPEKITFWSEQCPAWDVGGGRVSRSILRSGVLASGWLLGEKYLVGKAALLDVPMGQGHLIMFGMRPQYRGQSYQNFKLLFNALVAYLN